MRWNLSGIQHDNSTCQPAVGKLRVMDEDGGRFLYCSLEGKQPTNLDLPHWFEWADHKSSISRCIIISGWPLSVFVQQRSRLFVGGDLALVLCASQIQGPKVSCLWPGCHRIRTYGSRGRAVFYWHVALNMLCPWSHHVSPQIWILSDSASLWHPLGMAKRCWHLQA